MSFMYFDRLLLAAEEAQPNADPLSQIVVQILPWVGIFFLFYLLMIKPQRREQQRKETMLQSLKKNDRVVTIGGIIGSVASVDQNNKEITLKIDENTRVKMLLSSIQSRLDDAAKEESAG